jgi:Fe-S oxidoreductase
MTDESKCTKCGFCKAICPIYRVLFIESYSPRGKILILREKGEEKKKKGQIAFYCTTCAACNEKCPLAIDVVKIMISHRSLENAAGRERPANKRMIENIRKWGNPFGEPSKIKKPKELYCC